MNSGDNNTMPVQVEIREDNELLTPENVKSDNENDAIVRAK